MKDIHLKYKFATGNYPPESYSRTPEEDYTIWLEDHIKKLQGMGPEIRAILGMLDVSSGPYEVAKIVNEIKETLKKYETDF